MRVFKDIVLTLLTGGLYLIAIIIRKNRAEANYYEQANSALAIIEKESSK